jgi:putative transcriptional regulator
MARLGLDPEIPPRLSAAERRRLERMTDADITAGANEDADNKPLTRDELAKLHSARLMRQARWRSGLSQAAFARTYRINAARLRNPEQGRTQADSALLAYLTVIERDPEAVRRALDA